MTLEPILAFGAAYHPVEARSALRGVGWRKIGYFPIMNGYTIYTSPP
jgi:hypothetical protein